MSRVRRFGVLALGIALVVAGAAVWLSAPSGSAGFGWTAYAPLSSTVFRPDTGGVQRAIGAALAAAGGMLVTGWIGFRLGRRRT